MNLQGAGFAGTAGRLARLSRLDLDVFDDVRDDETATLPAIGIVIASSFLSGLGSWLWWVFQDFPNKGEVFLKSLILGGAFQIGAWYLWVYVTYSFLARSFGAVGGTQQLVRTMGFAFVPMSVSFFVLISVLSVPFGVIALSGTLLLSSIAVQRTTSASAEQSLVATFLGFAAFAVIMGILGNVAQVLDFGGLAPGLFFFVLD